MRFFRESVLPVLLTAAIGGLVWNVRAIYTLEGKVDLLTWRINALSEKVK